MSTDQNTQKNTLSHQPKENVIDSNFKLALAFATKKLLLKAWKSFLIVKMHNIHKQHLERLSSGYLDKKLKSKYLSHWKLYVKLILPEERMHRKAS
jgi:hypothetical protein